MKKQNESWYNYLKNTKATKNPKTFSLTFERDQYGNFHVAGHQARMLKKVGRQEKWVRVRARDLVKVLNESEIIAK